MRISTVDNLLLAGLILLFVAVITTTYFSTKGLAPVQSCSSWYEYNRCVDLATRLGQPMTPCADLMPPEAQED